MPPEQAFPPDLRWFCKRSIVFDNVVSTAEAIEQLTTSTYDLVITDLGRRWSSDRSHVAGRTLLEHPVIANGGPPIIVYAGREATRQETELLALGAFGVSQNREHLLELVRLALGRRAPSTATNAVSPA
jgi:hypothetical protein